MFGMGFTEILLIAVLAIIFIGPDRLPSMMVDIVKFFRGVKNTIGTVKDSIEEEINISDIQKEALAYKKELLGATEELDRVKNFQSTIDDEISSIGHDILNDSNKQIPLAPKALKEPEEVTFSKKSKKEKKSKKKDKIDV